MLNKKITKILLGTNNQGKIREIKDSVKGVLPNVYLLHGDMADEEINELYKTEKQWTAGTAKEN